MRARRMASRGIPLSGIRRNRNEHVCPRNQTAARARLEPQRPTKTWEETPDEVSKRLQQGASHINKACAWSFPIGIVLWSLTRRVTAFASENGFRVTEQANVAEVTLTESQKNTKNNTATIVHAVCI